MGKLEIMFYNALVVFLPAVFLALITGDFTKVETELEREMPHFNPISPSLSFSAGISL